MQVAGSAGVIGGRFAALEPRLTDALGGVWLMGATVLVCYGALAQGAFFWDQASFFAAGAAVLGFAASSRAGERDVGAPDAGTLDVGGARGVIGVGLLAAGLVAGVAANGWTPDARLPFAGLVAGASAIAVVRAICRRGERMRYFEVLTAVGAAVSIVGLMAIAFHFHPWATRAQGIWRLASTLTYVNAAACLLMLTAPAAIAVVRARASASSNVALSLILAGLVATLSRGALLACVAGGVVFVRCGGWLPWRRLVRPVAGAAVIVAGALPSVTGSAGRPMPAILGVIAGAVVAIPRRAGVAGRAKVAAFAALAPLVLAPVLFVAQGGGRIVDARAAGASEDRTRTWSAAFDQAMRRPWFGSGPGSFRLIERVGNATEQTRFAHNEYLQAFSETGVVGLGFLLSGAWVLASWARRRRPAAADDQPIWALALAACAAFAVHGATDFVWRLPALVFLAFGWLGVAVSSTTSREEQP